MRKTVYFNGQPLPRKVGITSFTVSTPDISFKTLDVPNRTGLIRYGKKIGNRSVQMNCVLLGDSISENSKIIRNLYQWCYSEEPKSLVVPGMTQTHLMSECEVFPPVDIAKPGTEFQIVFKANDPAFIQNDESSAATGNYFGVSGDLPVFPKITQYCSSNITNPIWYYDSNPSTYVMINTTIVAGSTIVIDCEHDRVTVNGSSVNASVDINSTLSYRLTQGTHIVTTANGAAGTVYWHNAFMWGT